MHLFSFYCFVLWHTVWLCSQGVAQIAGTRSVYRTTTHGAPFSLPRVNPVGMPAGLHRPDPSALPCCVTLEFINFSVACHRSLTWVNTVGQAVLSLPPHSGLEEAISPRTLTLPRLSERHGPNSIRGQAQQHGRNKACPGF